MAEMDTRDIRIGLLEIASSILKAADRIAGAIDRQAEATVLLARATAGEFDEGEKEEPDPNAKPLPPGYKGMR